VAWSLLFLFPAFPPLEPHSSLPYSSPRHSQDKHFPISLHELTACIYYKLAIERGVRGCYPDEEFYQHLTPQSLQTVLNQATTPSTSLLRKNDWKPEHDEEEPNAVCEELSNEDLDVIIKYTLLLSCFASLSAPISLF
jgi:hypothetical protein